MIDGTGDVARESIRRATRSSLCAARFWSGWWSLICNWGGVAASFASLLVTYLARSDGASTSNAPTIAALSLSAAALASANKLLRADAKWKAYVKSLEELNLLQLALEDPTMDVPKARDWYSGIVRVRGRAVRGDVSSSRVDSDSHA